jgi:DNA modification methylase
VSRFTLHLGDARDHLRSVPDGSVDLLLTDPPYNLGRYSTGNMTFSWRKEINNDVAAWDIAPFDPGDWLPEFRRVLAPHGNLMAFTSYNLLGRWHEVFDPVFDTFQFFAWHKKNPVPSIRRSSFLNSVELVICCWNRGHAWNFSRQNEMHNFIEAPICMGHERVKSPHHPTQKPLRVLEHLIRISSQPDALVLDPFMGVGSTGVAALKLGRRFIGMELDPAYYEAAETRLVDAEREVLARTDAGAG